MVPQADDPRFRVYVFEGVDNASSCYDLSDADLLDVVRWAQARCGPNERYAVALVQDAPQADGTTERGPLWLLGADANTSDPDPRIAERLSAMDARRERPIIVDP